MFVVLGCWLGACTGETVTPGETEAAVPARPIELAVKLLDPPSGPGAMAPRLTSGPSGVLLTWLQPIADVEPRESPRRGAQGTIGLMTAELAPGALHSRPSGATWSAPREIVHGDGFFANWADLPAAVEGPGGIRFAHWLERLADGSYTYGVQLARSGDGGDSWQRLGLLHDDASHVEHGFVSYVALAGGVQAFWLDGRAMAGGAAEGGHSHGEHTEHQGSMQLRTTRLGADGGPPPSTLLDERVCECCSTDAALTDGGPIVVYRDRDGSEIRDVAVVRATGDGWSEPAILHADRWQIHGCPVNGPAVAAAGGEVAVAWFTAAEGIARVLVAFSSDSGVSFGAPIEVDGEQPAGRVDIVLDDAGRAGGAQTEHDAWVSWMGTAGDDAEIRLRRVAPSGELGRLVPVAATAGSRSAGLPRMARHGGDAVLTWVEDTEPPRVQVGVVSLD